MNEELTERQKGLLTLLTDKMIKTGNSMGANRRQNWRINPCYDNSDIPKMQGTLDRIGKIRYSQTFHVDNRRKGWNLPRLGPDLYDHSIRCEWRELFGPGDKNPADCLKTMMKQDSTGGWHMPCDEGMWIGLWHPNEQEFQEGIHDCWLSNKRPHWRPVYNYTRDEVIEALKIMCETFDWEFEDGGEGTYCIM